MAMSSSASLFTAQLLPNRGLGFLVLGASLHDVLTRIKAEPQKFPELELLYSRDRPVDEPVTVVLPANGLRMRFDGPEQRLRLIEVIDFTKNHITFKDRDVVRPQNGAPASPVPGESSSGPSFRHIYHRLLGPTYGGEYIPPPSESDDDDEDGGGGGGNGGNGAGVGVYVLSYPGVAFTFPLPDSAYSPDKDVVALLSTPASQIATSMAVYGGDSWAAARDSLWTEVLPGVKAVPAPSKGRDACPDEISLVRIHSGGALQLFRKWTGASFWVRLGETTPQELVAELGPPNAVYRKNDQRMVIHRLRTTSNGRPSASNMARPDDLTDTDQSSMQTGSEEDSDDAEAVDDSLLDGSVAGECFYNYFHLGFDVLVAAPAPPSRAHPNGTDPAAAAAAAPAAPATAAPPPRQPIKAGWPDGQVAAKLVLHGNVPGSYEFNRHRRCRWEISYPGAQVATSETRFADVEDRLAEAWRPDGRQPTRQRGMVLNRGWGDSPGSSCEFLGGWEESSGGVRRGGAGKAAAGTDDGKDDTTTLFGFPGLVFEVLRNGYVNTLTVF